MFLYMVIHILLILYIFNLEEAKYTVNSPNKRLKIEDITFPQGNRIDLFMDHGKQSRKAVIGDSHALSVWRPDHTLDFTPGRTLHGFLKRNTPELLNQIFDEVTLYFGNIDLRFHLMRQENPRAATGDLFRRYTEFRPCLKRYLFSHLRSKILMMLIIKN